MNFRFGVIPGWDMTAEAALTKRCFILGRTDWSLEKKREIVQCNLRGELTKVNKASSSQHLLASAKREYLAEPRDFLLWGSNSISNTNSIPILKGVPDPEAVVLALTMVGVSWGWIW
jgi:lysophospholipase